ncbi:unnamed protein product [Meganyctiphanes norvegica]|uniref:Uncharacterized protein n=1 Tax=Meganyctiphanes norvegica TaxID=48144 RepID=A0AAV2RFL9_MEGNR
MDKHEVEVLVRLIGVVALVVGAARVTSAFTCYKCNNILGDPDFDRNCPVYSYNGKPDIHIWEACYIEFYVGGLTLRRGTNGSGYYDGYCTHGSGYTGCYCKADLCNTNSNCSQCYPTQTPTTDAASTTLPSTTSSPDSLACYQCVGCSSVDSSTPVISDASYQSCVTTVVLNSGNVIRDGSYDQHPDGECAQDEETKSCWCSSNRCNTIEL